jgi:pyruvate-formate lyase-activating enzyme
MKKIIKIENNHDPKKIRVEWAIGNTCNYRCNYCFPGSHEGDIPWPAGENVELLKNNFTHLFDYYLKNNKDVIQLYLLGGETTLWKHLPEFLTHFKNKYQDRIIVHMATNGFRKVHWWEKYAKLFDHIEISVHNEFCDPNHIIEVADYLFSHKHMVVANVLMDPKNFDKCRSIVEKFQSESKYNWPIILKAIHIDGVTSYPSEQKDYLQSAKKRVPDFKEVEEFFRGTINRYWVTFEDGEVFELPSDSWIRLNKLNYFAGWECTVGVNDIKVLFNGDITVNCNQKLYGLDYYFNIFDQDFVQNFSPEIKPVICKQLQCLCNGEVTLAKHKVS